MSKILIVEDDLSIKALLHDFIQEAGYSVVLAADGVETLAKYSEQSFDLMLLDISQTMNYKDLTLDLEGYKVYTKEDAAKPVTDTLEV